jgi:hypothetical protein
VPVNVNRNFIYFDANCDKITLRFSLERCREPIRKPKNVKGKMSNAFRLPEFDRQVSETVSFYLYQIVIVNCACE